MCISQLVNMQCSADDVILMGFLGTFGKGQDLTQSQNQINLAFHGLTETQSGITSCQSANKAVILSIGGSAGSYGFDRWPCCPEALL